MSELKPCPFCGGEAELRDDGVDYPYSVQCTECGGMTCWYLHDDTPFGAIDAWNMRAEPTCRNVDDNKTVWFICSECGGTRKLAHMVGGYCPNCVARVEEG